MKNSASPDMFTLFEDKTFLVRFDGEDGIINDLVQNKFQTFSAVTNNYGLIDVAFQRPANLPPSFMDKIQKLVRMMDNHGHI